MGFLGPFLEGGINPQILKEYDMTVEKATRNRRVIKVETNLGDFAVKKANIGLNQAEKMYMIVEFLRKKDFPVINIVTNKFDERFIPNKEGIFYITKWIDGKELSLNNYDALKRAIVVMAKMHIAGFSFDTKLEGFRYVDEMYIRKSWEERIEWLEKYNKKIKKKHSTTAFEHLYLTYSPFILEWAEVAIEELNQWIIHYNSIGKLRKTISHGKFHHRNLLVAQDGKLYILDFEHVSIDTPVRDLAYFIRHYISDKEQRVWAQEWITLYQKILPLSSSELRLLAVYLLFPERLISLIRSYEKRESILGEEEYLRKLQIRWGQLKELKWFVDQNSWLYKY